MGKKNPYVTTIGFNRDDPDHVYVADFLNTMGRGKAQYIVKAVIAYQNPDGVSAGQVVVPAVDYEKIRAFVLKVIEEKINIDAVLNPVKNPKKRQETHEEQVEVQETVDLDEATVNDIMQSLNMFR